MTARRDRNRATRRTAEAFAGSYRCPDCSADSRLTEHTPGIYLLEVAHDPTCPLLAAMTADGEDA
ncbi:MAG TPA: hypothetical protein VFH38_09380 [Jatrophihabitans sp.]|nr:hypothetical protein [Jatrophihabitans sp.]